MLKSSQPCSRAVLEIHHMQRLQIGLCPTINYVKHKENWQEITTSWFCPSAVTSKHHLDRDNQGLRQPLTTDANTNDIIHTIMSLWLNFIRARNTMVTVTLLLIDLKISMVSLSEFNFMWLLQDLQLLSSLMLYNVNIVCYCLLL